MRFRETFGLLAEAGRHVRLVIQTNHSTSIPASAPVLHIYGCWTDLTIGCPARDESDDVGNNTACISSLHVKGVLACCRPLDLDHRIRFGCQHYDAGVTFVDKSRSIPREIALNPVSDFVHATVRCRTTWLSNFLGLNAEHDAQKRPDAVRRITASDQTVRKVTG